MNPNVVNMFAAKKVKLHGMTSSKWATRDKITQYKGLINLYTRDRKIIELDTNINKKKTQRELKDTAKSVYTDRRALDNAIRGDKQKLRNTLSEHKELQLAYQNSQPKKVIEEIDQLNFNRRKVLDKLKYDKKMKSGKLTDLKLEKALLDDRLKYGFLGQLREEKEAQMIAGKVQDATLRREAACTIHRIYREILNIMKKDALYFDVIIATVKNDGYSQSKFFLGATKLGQLATEYLDDRRQEYDTLEKIILKDMATRKVDIRILHDQVENATASIKQLLRKDSDITTCMIKITDSPSLDELHKDVNHIEKLLTSLKNATLAPSYEAIYPCLEEQIKQRHRLKNLVRKCERDRDTLLNKTNHAEVMNAVLRTTGNDDITELATKQQELLTAINELKNEKENYRKVIGKNRNIAAHTRVALRQLLQLSYCIKSPEGNKEKVSVWANYLMFAEKEKTKGMEIPKEDETDGSKIIPILLQKFSILMNAYHSKAKEDKVEETFKQFEAMMQERMILASSTGKIRSDTSLLQGLFTEASQQLTREDIKKQSEEIVAANAKNDDLVPMFELPKKRKK